MRNNWYRSMRSLSEEGRAIAAMLVQCLEGEHTARGRVGRFFKASLMIFGRRAPKASLRLVRCDEGSGRPFGCARTVVVPITDIRDPLAVAVSLERQAFMSARQRQSARVSGEGQSFHRPHVSRGSH
jgi:hypothetical protein